MGSIGSSETSTCDYRYSLRNGPEESSSRPLRDGSLKSRLGTVVLWQRHDQLALPSRPTSVGTGILR